MFKKGIIVIFLLLITVSFLAGCTDIKDVNSEWGDAPDFSLKTLEGKNIKLSDYKGNIILLDFMGVDCPYCVYQMPALKSVSENYTEIIIISIDVYQYETEAYLQSFIDAFDRELGMKLDWIFGMDSDGSIAKDYVPDGGVPKVVLIDENGNIYHSFSGYTQYPEISKKLDKLI